MAAVGTRARADPLIACRAAAAVPAALGLPRPKPARVPAGARVRPALPADLRGTPLRPRPGQRSHAVALRLSPLRVGVSRRRVRARLPDVPPPTTGLPTRGRQARTARRARCAHRHRALARRSTADGVFAPCCRRSGLDRRLVGRRHGVRRGHGAPALDVSRQRRRQELPVTRRRPIVRRYVRGEPLRARPVERRGALAGVRAAAPLRPWALLFHSGRRARASVPRRDRREGLCIRRPERKAALVILDGRLCLRVAGDLARPRARRLVQPPLLRARRGDRARPLVIRCRRPHLGLGVRRRRRRVRLDISRAHVRFGRAHGSRAVELPRREVLRRIGRRHPLLPRRLRPAVRPGSPAVSEP